MPGSATAPIPAVETVVFDVDGTLLDSAPGILAGFGKALVAGGLVAPDAARLRVYLGPPLREFLTTYGVAADRLDSAAQAYHDFYLAEGLHQARPYAGIEDLLQRLRVAGVRLATATAKRTTTAQAIVAAHGLASYFTLVAGTDETRLTKADTLAGVLSELDADPATTIMVGDRRHDIAGAHACGVRAVGAGWGYAVDDELIEAGAVWVVGDVETLGRLLGV